MTRAARWRVGALVGLVGLLASLVAVGALTRGTSAAWQDRVHLGGTLVADVLTPDPISAGKDFTCAVVFGKAWCWGAGDNGKLGTGSAAAANVPVAVDTRSMSGTVTDVSAGVDSACAATSGSAWCWGVNGGLLGNFPTDPTNPYTSPLPVKVYAAPEGPGPNDYRSPLAGQTVTSVAAGNFIACASGAEGGAGCWGSVVRLTRPSSGPLSRPNAPIVVPDSATDPTSELPVGARVTATSSRFENACVLADGWPYCWGVNTEGQLGIGTTGSARSAPVAVSGAGDLPAGAVVDKISVGEYHSCALSAGQVYCWGQRSAGAVGDGNLTSLSQVAPSRVTALSALTATDVGTGTWSSCAVVTTGDVYCWGTNSDGQLGSPTATQYQAWPTPVLVSRPSGVTFTAVTVGNRHACATTTTGAVYCWGAAGTLGTGPGQVQTMAPTVPVTATWAP